MNQKRIHRRIIIAILASSIFATACMSASRYPKIIALGFVNAGFEISILDLNNTTRQYVTNSKVIAPTSYSYCQAKNQIAFSAFVEDGEELIFQDLANAHTEALTQGNNHFRHPVWSSDCSALAFTSYDSSSNVLLLKPENSQTYPAALDEGISLEGASWSPNSHFLATYIPIPSQNNERFDLGIIDVPTNKLTTRLPGFVDYPFSEVVWNAESNQLYFSAVRNSASFDIYVFDLEEEIEKPVVQTGFDDRYPLLSPDGKHISFLQSSSKDAYILGLFDLSSNKIEFMTSSPIAVSAMLWLDNQRLLLSEYNPTENQTIYYVLDIKTEVVKEVSRFDGRFIAPKTLRP